MSAETTAPTSAETAAPASAKALLTRMLSRHRTRLLAFVSLLALWQAGEAMVPVLIGVIVDRAVATGDVTQMIIWASALAVLFAVFSNCYRFGSRIGFATLQREMHLLRLEIARHALHPRGVRTERLTGEMLSLATSDAQAVGFSMRSFGYTVAAFGSVLLSVVILLRTDLVLGIVVIIGVPLMLALTQVITPVIARRSRAQQSKIAAAAGMATDFVRGMRVIKGVGAEDVASSRYRSRSAQARDASIRTATSEGAMVGLSTTLSGLFLAVVAALAGLRALDGQISIGELITVVGLTQFLAEPMMMLAGVGTQVATAYGSAGRIVDFLHSPLLDADDGSPSTSPAPQRPGRSSSTTPSAELDLADLDCAGLQGVNLSLQHGELVGIVVEDPTDAATLLSLLTGERRPDGGRVLLRDSPLHDLDIHRRRSALLVNPHHTDLFEGTVRGNIDLLGTLDEAAIQQVVQAAAVDDIVSLHPDGLDQPVTSGGKTFSGGQQQRIALARALATQAPVLVLHDPTSAVDAVTEQRIAEGITRLRRGRSSTLVITTSPALLARADRVVVIRDGQVVLEGVADDLATDVIYQELVLR